MLCLSGFELYSRWVPLRRVPQGLQTQIWFLKFDTMPQLYVDRAPLTLACVQTLPLPSATTTTTTSFTCMTIQTHTVLQKLCLGLRITTQGNYVALIIICHEHQNKLKYNLLYIDKVIRRG